MCVCMCVHGCVCILQKSINKYTFILSTYVYIYTSIKNIAQHGIRWQRHVYMLLFGGMDESISSLVLRWPLCCMFAWTRHQILHKYDNVYTAERERAREDEAVWYRLTLATKRLQEKGTWRESREGEKEEGVVHSGVLATNTACAFSNA